MIENLSKKLICAIFFVMISFAVNAGGPPPPDDEIPITDNIGFLVLAGGLYLVKAFVQKKAEYK